ncbi:MAG TPA: hypothetical protein VFN48_08570 [Solirubrobacteraceae bacterium]|nr:hypothetical protein [Solirubrobacteraceae bacterium]
MSTTMVSLPVSALPPIALGFMGLGTGYLIYGPQELFGYPKRDKVSVDFPMGVWGIFMPGLMQMLTGLILFLGLDLFGTFNAPILYMAALAFTSYGIHWFAIGWSRMHGSDARVLTGMAVAFLLLSVLGVVAFFGAHDSPVGGLFIGLCGVYVAEILVSLAPVRPGIGAIGERILGFFHLGTGLWLMYLVWAVVLDFTLKYTLPV